ncbi:MAG: Flp pilus assembly protein TadG, partial [Pseudomonadota bacterium]
VPYTATVNIGADREAWLDPNDIVFDDDVDWFAPTEWKGCVMARPAPFDESDTPPATEPFDSFFYATDTDNVWPAVNEANGAQNNGTGPNLGCGPEITSLRNNKGEIEDAIDEMLPWHRGGTTGNLGLVWGWRALSPNWRGLWGDGTPATMPLDYNSASSDKVIVMLTDGDNQFYDNPPSGPDGSDVTAYGRLGEFGFASLHAANVEIDERMARACTAMKTQGVILYTITFGSSPDAATQQLYSDCATSAGHYFHSPSNGDLSDIFKAIGRQLSELRIAQ